MTFPAFPKRFAGRCGWIPTVILVGEMRDLATISAAITAAETGHIVFATLHTASAEGTVNRIIDVFPKEQQDQIRTQLSVALIGVLCQALLPRKPKGLIAAYELLVVTSGHREPDPRKQDVPHHVRHPDRQEARHGADGRQPVQPVEAGPHREGRRRPEGDQGTWNCGSASNWPSKAHSRTRKKTTRTKTKTRKNTTRTKMTTRKKNSPVGRGKVKSVPKAK